MKVTTFEGYDFAGFAGHRRHKKHHGSGSCSPHPYKKRRGKGGGKLLAKGWRYSKHGGKPIRSKHCR